MGHNHENIGNIRLLSPNIGNCRNCTHLKVQSIGSCLIRTLEAAVMSGLLILHELLLSCELKPQKGLCVTCRHFLFNFSVNCRCSISVATANKQLLTVIINNF